MIPEEKAKELVEKFMSFQVHHEYDKVGDRKERAKQCALICCKEILNILFQHHEIDYWKQVKEEIEKL